MENTRVSVWKGTLNAGIFTSLLMVLYSLLLYFLDQSLNKVLPSLGFLIFIVGLYLGIRSFRDTGRGGFLSYGQVLGAGTVMSLYVAIITAVFTYLFYAVIDPDLIVKMKDIQREILMRRGISDEQIERSLKIVAWTKTPWALAAFSLVGTVFWGFIITLVEGIFLKREPENPFAEVTEEEQ